jgi:hypothetical protein
MSEPSASAWRWDGDVLQVALVGRLTPSGVDVVDAALTDALSRDGRFAIVLDRRRLGAPTAEGRSALERWAASSLGRLADRCAGWADVFDERRFRSLTRDGTVESRGAGYPQRTFGDHGEAQAWAREQLTARVP